MSLIVKNMFHVYAYNGTYIEQQGSLLRIVENLKIINYYIRDGVILWAT